MTAAPTFWTAASLLTLPFLTHGVTERGGGISSEPYATLNLGLHVGDDAPHVRENRRRAAAALGFSPADMVCAEQVHGNQVAVASAAEVGTTLPGVDALVTETPGLLLALFYADCLPVLLADPDRRVVAVAHAGWRGLDAGVLENTIHTLGEQFGSAPRTLLAAIGPGIGPCCFEVGEEVAEHFPNETRRPEGKARPFVDLPRIAARRLRAAGIALEHITGAEECTSCLPDRYFSHRRDRGRTGRMGAFIGILQTI